MTKNTEWFMLHSHAYVRHDAFKCATWLIHMKTKETTCKIQWLMTHSYVKHDSFTCVTWLIHMTTKEWPKIMSDSCLILIFISEMTHSNVQHDSFTWPPNWRPAIRSGSILIQVLCMTHSRVWDFSFIRQAQKNLFYNTEWLMTHLHGRYDSFMYMLDMTHSCMSETWLIHVCLRHDSFMYVLDMTHSAVEYQQRNRGPEILCMLQLTDVTYSYAWLICKSDMTHSYVLNDSFIRGAWLIHFSDMTHSYVCDKTYLFI